MNPINSIEFIEKSINSLDEFIDAFSNLNIALSELNTIQSENLAVKVSAIRFNFIDNIYLSILAGEFYSEDFLRQVHFGLEKSKRLSIEIDKLRGVSGDNSTSTYKNFSKAGEYYLTLEELYKYSINRLNTSVIPLSQKLWEREQKTIALKLFEEIKISSNLDNQVDFRYKLRYSLFRINVLLFLYENDLVCSDLHLNELYFIKDLLSNEEYKTVPICSLLIEKINYLIFKSLRRFENGSEIVGNNPDDKLSNFSNPKYFSEFNDLTSKIWINHSSKLDPSSIHQLITNFRSNSNHKLSEIHFIVKTIRKKLEREYENSALDEIISFYYLLKTELLEKLGNEKILFDRIAYLSFINLINHNLLDISIKKAKKKIGEESSVKLKKEIEKLVKLYNSLKREQETNGRMNHIAAKKLLNFFIQILKVNSWSSESREILLYLENTINKIVKDAQEQLRWEQRHFALPLYLTFSESIITYSGSNPNLLNGSNEIGEEQSKLNFKLFLDSSYVLPVNYVKVENEIDLLIFDYEQLRLVKMMEMSTLIAENAKNQVQDEVKNSLKLYISTLGVFATITSFVLSSIRVVPELDSLNEKVVFMLFFGITLILFILTLEFFVVERDGKIFSKRALIYLLTFIFVIAMYMVYFSGGFTMEG